MKIFIKTACIVTSFVLLACNNNNSGNNTKTSEDSVMQKGSFGYDLNFLKQRDSILILKNENGNAQVIVSPKYQGKVFTSTAEGIAGKSFGWVNYKAFDEPVNNHMNAYGGEDRLWLGPEGGKFSLYFAKGAEMVFDNWHTPAGIDSEPWQLNSSSDKKVSMSKEMQLVNYAGTPLNIGISREVKILENAEINAVLGIEIPADVNTVGFATINQIKNNGANAWTETTGAPCIWMLDMFMPSEKCTIVIPYNDSVSGKVATTDYFGEIEKERIVYKNGVLFFKADGKSRGKLGIPPARAKNMAGSYDALNKVLTITKFTVYNNKKYLNQEWNTSKDPFSGDAVNAYNDGPLQDGSQMGPFYEIESVAPPAFLKPGETQTHHHDVFHFTGNEQALNSISLKLLGVGIDEIQKVFQ